MHVISDFLVCQSISPPLPIRLSSLSESCLACLSDKAIFEERITDYSQALTVVSVLKALQCLS